MERTSICAACVAYAQEPVSLSVDPACRSAREADRLCTVHRARATEGYCVLCGRREPWASPWSGSRIGACESCFGEVFGTDHARAVEGAFARERETAAGGASRPLELPARPGEGEWASR